MKDIKELSQKSQNEDSEIVKPPIEYPHGIPVTRRDLLKAGVVQFAAAMSTPSLLSLLAKSGVAEAADCLSSAASDLPVYVNVNMAGGNAIMSNFVARDQGGQLLASYGLLGMGRLTETDIVPMFANNASFYRQSGMMAGMNTVLMAATTPATARTNTVLVGMPVRTMDDSSQNRWDITGAVTRAGLKGATLPNMGTRGTVTGNNNQPAFGGAAAPPAPLIVRGYNDIVGAMSVEGALGRMSANQRNSLFRMLTRLTGSQSRKLASLSAGEQLQVLAECGAGTNQQLISSGAQGTDPLENTALSAVWGINAATNRSSQQFVFAAMMYNALKGNSGTVNIDLGGYDYHNNPRANTDARDNAAGTVIGQIIASAAVMGKRLFLTVTTDGAVGSANSDVGGNMFTSDRGSGGGCYAMAFDPAKPPQTSGSQIGWMVPGQAADTRFITGDNAELAAGALFANYMSFAGRAGNIELVIPRLFTRNSWTRLLRFTRVDWSIED